MGYNTIKLKDMLHIREEYKAASAVTPGMLLELNGSSKVQAHSSAGQNILPMVAYEDELQGKTIDEDYAADDPVQCWVPTRGDKAYLILADGQNITQGDFLESDGNGYVQKHEADSAGVVEYGHPIVGVALEDLDLSGSSGEESSGPLGYNKRIKVQIL
jgi:hypothetical protein